MWGQVSSTSLQSNKIFLDMSANKKENREEKYEVSKVHGGERPIYDFKSPSEFLVPDVSKGTHKKKYLVYYFSRLYPLTPKTRWEVMSVDELQDYYDNLNYWYTFNSSWTIAPMPQTLSENVVDKWEKNTFYQAGTIVQTGITSWGWGLDNDDKKVYLAARLNNAPRVDAQLTYEGKKGKVTTNSVAVDEDYWETVLDKKIEITCWGWNPYPFGIYGQGPFTGSGIFLHIATTST